VLLVLAALHYIVILAVLLPLAAPNFGEISRYKVAYLPFFVYLVLAALRTGKARKEGKRGNHGDTEGTE
jgi:hypothetical protein